MTVADPTIIKWLNRQSADLTEEGAITLYELYHAVTGENPERLERFPASDDNEELSHSIWSIAEHDASTRTSGRVQRYLICAYRDKENEPSSSHPFKVMGKAVNILSDDSDPASEKGALGAVMSQNKALHNTLMQLTEATSGRLARDLEVERRKREALETRLMEQFEKIQSIEDRAHERELEKARELRSAQRHEQIMGMLVSVAPAMLSRIIGSNSAGASMMRDESLGQFLKNISAEEMGAVMNALKTPNRIALLELYAAHRDKFEAEEKDKPKILREGGEPEAESESDITH